MAHEHFITAYFMVSTMVGSANSTLTLPYFKATENLGATIYTWVTSCAVIGRLIGGVIHYRFRYPTEKKFAIAFFVYIVSAVIDGGYLFTPVIIMMITQFISGLICVTSFNIRISSTQNYVPNEMRGRYNGTYQMLTTVGSIIGQLSAGVLGEVFPYRAVMVAMNLFALVAAIAIMYPGRDHVKRIYNVDI